MVWILLMPILSLTRHTAVLSVVHTVRKENIRIISFRYASRIETEMYYDWLENDYEDPQ